MTEASPNRPMRTDGQPDGGFAVARRSGATTSGVDRTDPTPQSRSPQPNRLFWPLVGESRSHQPNRPRRAVEIRIRGLSPVFLGSRLTPISVGCSSTSECNDEILSIVADHLCSTRASAADIANNPPVVRRGLTGNPRDLHVSDGRAHGAVTADGANPRVGVQARFRGLESASGSIAPTESSGSHVDCGGRTINGRAAPT